MYPLQQQHGNQGCPNLDTQRVLASAHETFHFEVLLERLEEQLHLPAVLVKGGNGGGAKGQQIGQQHNLSLVNGIPDNHAPEHGRAVIVSFAADESDQARLRFGEAMLREPRRTGPGYTLRAGSARPGPNLRLRIPFHICQTKPNPKPDISLAIYSGHLDVLPTSVQCAGSRLSVVNAWSRKTRAHEFSVEAPGHMRS